LGSFVEVLRRASERLKRDLECQLVESGVERMDWRPSDPLQFVSLYHKTQKALSTSLEDSIFLLLKDCDGLDVPEALRLASKLATKWRDLCANFRRNAPVMPRSASLLPKDQFFRRCCTYWTDFLKRVQEILDDVSQMEEFLASAEADLEG